jgi:hypothetical protein
VLEKNKAKEPNNIIAAYVLYLGHRFLLGSKILNCASKPFLVGSFQPIRRE